MPEFKAGDKVYIPKYSTEILTVSDCGGAYYPLAVSGVATFTPYGHLAVTARLPDVFHATAQNYELLSKLYSIEFEKPDSKPTPREIIKHLLTKQMYVPCYVSDTSETVATTGCPPTVVIISQINCDMFFTTSGTSWQYAVPCDPVTGEVITEIE